MVSPPLAARMHSARPPAPLRPAAGFTLVEILIAIIVLSIGLLGAVGMQLTAMKGSLEAQRQSMAMSLARELAEQLRGNKQEALTTNAYDIDIDFSDGETQVEDPPLNCAAVACTDRANMAAWEVSDWLIRVSALLPGARVRLCIDSQPYDANGLPRWECDDAGSVYVLKMGWTRADTRQGELLTAANPPFLALPLTPGSEE